VGEEMSWGHAETERIINKRIADAVAAEREACALAVERAYLACTKPEILSRRAWARIVDEAKAEIRARAQRGSTVVHGGKSNG